MKRTKITTAALALAFAAALSTAAHAQLATYNEGDLLIGFENGGANNYIVDLGSASKFLDATSNLSFSLSASDLASAFTSNWATTANVQWGVIGGSDSTTSLTLGSDTLAKNTLFFTKGESTVGTQTTAPKVFTPAASNNDNSNIQSFANEFASTLTSAGSTAGLQAVVESSTDSAGWTGNNPKTNAFQLGLNIEQPATGGATGATNSALDLYEAVPSTASPAPSAKYLGDFTLNSSGVLTFNVTAQSVPEPASYALAGIAIATFLVLRRRKAISGS
jgi:hypothetical protein